MALNATFSDDHIDFDEIFAKVAGYEGAYGNGRKLLHVQLGFLFLSHHPSLFHGIRVPSLVDSELWHLLSIPQITFDGADVNVPQSLLMAQMSITPQSLLTTRMT